MKKDEISNAIKRFETVKVNMLSYFYNDIPRWFFGSSALLFKRWM